MLKIEYRVISKETFPIQEPLAITSLRETEYSFGLRNFQAFAQESYEKQQLNSNRYGYSSKISNGNGIHFFASQSHLLCEKPQLVLKWHLLTKNFWVNAQTRKTKCLNFISDIRAIKLSTSRSTISSSNQFLFKSLIVNRHFFQ